MSGLIGDFLTPPLSPAEQVAGFPWAQATRGVAVGAIAGLAVLPFAHACNIAHLWRCSISGLARRW